MHYGTPRTLTDKKWTDQSLLSTESVDSYLAESDAFQRATFANIVQKWKQHDRSQVDRLISSFDDRYNMKTRFRLDDQLTRPSEKKYAPTATYYRYLGSESNPKNIRPCARHKRRTQHYQERHIQDLLKLPAVCESRNRSYVLSKKSKLPSIGTSIHGSSSVRSSVSLVDASQHTFS